MVRFLAIAGLFFGSILVVGAQEPEEKVDPALKEQAGPMTVERLNDLIFLLDENAERTANSWVFRINDLPLTVVSDPAADRMRMVIGIAEADSLTPELLERLMQANFDSALDARYSLAQDILWSTYIHPLSSLTTDEFISGLTQTMNLALTYGTSYSSGLFTFGGGDSGDIIQREELNRLLKGNPGQPT